MANPNTPRGLDPIGRVDQQRWGDALRKYFVPAANTHALFVGDPVKKVAASADIKGVNGVDLAGATGTITGVVCGYLGVCAAGTANPGFWGLASTPGSVYRPASTGQDYYVLVNDDPEALYIVQSNDAGGAPAVTVVGKNANLVAGAGNTVGGMSGWMLDSSTIAATQGLQVNIIGFLEEPDNIPGQANAKLLVRINQQTETPNTIGI